MKVPAGTKEMRATVTAVMRFGRPPVMTAKIMPAARRARMPRQRSRGAPSEDEAADAIGRLRWSVSVKVLSFGFGEHRAQDLGAENTEPGEAMNAQ